MTIPNVSPYTGNKPTPGQPQPEFNQNMSDELDYFNSLPSELNPAIDAINNTAIQVTSDSESAAASATAAETAAQSSGYAGLWPDTGGSALKGETWQTQAGGVPTGFYFLALQDTSVDPVGDNENWRETSDITPSSVPDYTDIVFKAFGGNSAIENMIAGRIDGNVTIKHLAGNIYSTQGDVWRHKGTNIGNETLDDFEALSDISLSSFGVIFDGATINTSAIDLAIAYAESSGVKLTAGEGVCLTDGGHDLDSAVIECAGIDSTTFKTTGVNQYMFALGGNGGLYNVELDLNNTSTQGYLQTSFKGAGVKISGNSDNIRIKNAGFSVIGTVTDVTLGTETTITANTTGLQDGDYVQIVDVNGCVSQNNPTRGVLEQPYVVYDVTSTEFKLAHHIGNPLDSTGYTAYIDGGTIRKIGYALVNNKHPDFTSSSKFSHTIGKIELRDNYGHILSHFSEQMEIGSARLYGNNGGYGLSIGQQTRDLSIGFMYTESGLNAYTGCRDVNINDLVMNLDPDWLRPAITGLGINSTFGNAGGEIAGFTIKTLKMSTNSVNQVGPFLDINAHEWSVENVKLRCRQGQSWIGLRDRGTMHLRLTNVTCESLAAFDFTDPNQSNGLHTKVDGLWYTQGVIGTAYWGRSRYASAGDYSMMTIKNSNLNHSIDDEGFGGAGYIFEQINGDIDLTNATEGCYLFGITGNVTSPEKAAIYRTESKSRTNADDTRITAFRNKVEVNGGADRRAGTYQAVMSGSQNPITVSLPDDYDSAMVHIELTSVKNDSSGGMTQYDIYAAVRNSGGGTLVQYSNVVENTDAKLLAGIGLPSVTWNISGTDATLEITNSATTLSYLKMDVMVEGTFEYLAD